MSTEVFCWTDQQCRIADQLEAPQRPFRFLSWKGFFLPLADSPCFHSHSWWSGLLRCQLESSISERVLPSRCRTERPCFQLRPFLRSPAAGVRFPDTASGRSAPDCHPTLGSFPSTLPLAPAPAARSVAAGPLPRIRQDDLKSQTCQQGSTTVNASPLRWPSGTALDPRTSAPWLPGRGHAAFRQQLTPLPQHAMPAALVSQIHADH